MFRAAHLFWLVCSTALFTGCWGGVSRHVLATVLSVEGEVIYQATERMPLKPLTSESNPASGSMLRTASNARVSLELVPGALVQISGNSEIRIEELLLSKDGNETEDGMRRRAARVRLIHGRLTIIFERRDDSEVRLAIATPAVTVTASEDCVCHVDAASEKTRVTCARGKAYGSAAGSEPFVVKAGYFQEWPSGPTGAAANDAAAQMDIADALEAEQMLQELQRDRLKRRPF
jgi:hypothetical protein